MSTQTGRRFAGVTKNTGGAIFTAMGVAVALLALYLLEPLQAASSEPAPGVSNPTAIVHLIVGIGVATVLLYGIVKLDLGALFNLGLGRVLKVVAGAAVVFFVGGYCMLFIALVLFPHLGLGYLWLAAPIVGFGLAVLLQTRPRWWVYNTVALCLAPLFTAGIGRGFAPGPVLLLLVILLVYDIISVYVTGHMVEMAEGVLEWDITLPIVVKLPLAEGDRDGMLLGVGDLVIPATLVTSAALWSPAPPVWGAANLPALWAIAGIAVGHLAMHVLPDREKPQAGLPFLNTGAIAGYFAGSLAAGLSLATALGAPYGVLPL